MKWSGTDFAANPTPTREQVMYQEFFGLGRRPFAAVPRVEHYFAAAAIEAARQTLVRCIQRAEGIGIVIGPSGTGKTLLCQMLATVFRDSTQVVLLLSGRLTSPKALLQAILFELGQPYLDMDEGELRLALTHYLTHSDECPHGMVLVVDEAHTLSLRVLEEIRMIANLVCGDQPGVRPVLVGGPLLEERLASPKLESFSQRIVARCYLEAFDRAETHDYIHTQLTQSGGQPDEVISAEACQAVYQATDGIPRLVNQLCDHALVLGFAAGRQLVDRAAIEEAWADLQQLPTPWNGEKAQGSDTSAVIEFGGLDDEPDDLPTDEDEPATIAMLRVTDESDDAQHDPVEQVAHIQETLGRLDRDFQPHESIAPEAAKVFETAADPFDEPFDEEEVIADRFVATTCLGDETSERSPPNELNELAAPEPAPESVPLHPQAEEERVEPPAETKPLIIVEDDYDREDLPIESPPVPASQQAYGRLFSKLRKTQ